MGLYNSYSGLIAFMRQYHYAVSHIVWEIEPVGKVTEDRTDYLFHAKQN